MLSTQKVGLFHLPLGCPRTNNKGCPCTKNDVREWLKNSKPNIFQKTSYGTYTGIAAVILGLTSLFIGYVKENNFCKSLGSVFAAIGAIATAIGKLCGVEFDAIGKISNRVIFNPPKDLETTPAKEGITHEEVSIVANGEKLHGYYLPAPIKTKKTVIFLHGRSNNIGTKSFIDNIKKIQEQIPVNVLMVDFRGFGNSSLNCGTITCDGVIEDAKAMYNHLITKRGCTPRDISLFGHSLGGAIAIQLANKEKVNSLIVQSSFTSLKDVVDYLLPRKDLVSKVLPDSLVSLVTSSNEFNSLEAIKTVKANKVCICHGEKDRLIPYEQAEKLFDAVTKPKVLITLDEADHSNYAKHFTEEQISKLRDLVGVNDICEENDEELPIAA